MKNTGLSRLLKTMYAVLCMVAASSCAGFDEEGLFSQVRIVLEFPDGRNAVLVTVEGDEDVSFFRNINTRRNYDYPLFVNGTGRMTVQKGVYVFGFDAVADFGDGTLRRVRSAQHRQPSSSVDLLDGEEELVVKLTWLD